MLTEQRALHSVNVNLDSKVLEVKWMNQILRDGTVIHEIPHRCAYKEADAVRFLADVPNGKKFTEAIGW